MNTKRTFILSVLSTLCVLSLMAFTNLPGAPTRHAGTATGTTTAVGNAPFVSSKTTGSNFLIPGSIVEALAAPSISSGFGGSAGIVGSATFGDIEIFQVNVGTSSAATGVIGLPTAATGWICHCDDITTQSTTVDYTKQTASTTASCTVGNFSDIAGAGAWTNNDKLNCIAAPY